MANIGDWEQMKLINELILGKELATQLQVHLNVPSSSKETREILVRRILNSYEKALSMLTRETRLIMSSSLSVVDQPHHPAGGAVVVGMSESPPSLGGSPHSEDSDRDTKDQINKHKDPAGSSRAARKCMPRWTQQVRVSPGMGLEGPLDDGFSWRKYGQKDILGAKYPRGYYRCTHRNLQGCLATKQVQRSDEDPTIFEITYRGRHTCTQATSHFPPPSQPQENQEPIIETQQNIHHQSLQENNPAPQPQQQSQELLFNFRRELKVITEDLEVSDLHDHQQSFPNSFHFINPSTSNSSPDQNGSTMFPPSVLGSSYMGNFSPSFASPSASGGMQQSYGGNQNFQSCDQYELITHHDHHVIPAATSTTNSPTVGFDFPFGNHDQFGPNFTFDSSGFFS